ncbi:hypothetical protein Tco_0633097 [Tanacetum coccineum]
MKRGFRGVPRPLLPAMLPVVAQNVGQADQAGNQSQPSSSTVPPPPTSQPAPTESTTIPPTPVTEPTSEPLSPSTAPEHEPMEDPFEQPSPEHQPSSPRQESDIPHTQAPTHTHEAETGHLSVDDLFQLVPQLMTRIDSLEKDLKQTKQTMGNAIVKLVKKVKKMEKIVKSRRVVLTDSEDEGETDISPQGLEAAETLAEVLSQIKTKRRNVKTGVRRRLDAEDVSTVLEETPQTKRTKKQIREEQASLAEIARIQAEEEAENARREELKRQDELAAKRLQEELELSEAQKKRNGSREDVSEADYAQIMVGLISQRRKLIAEQKAKAQRDKPMTQAQQRYEETEEYKIKKACYKITKKKSYARKRIAEEAESVTEEDIIRLEKRGSYQINREDNTDVVYVNFKGLLNDLTRDDLKEMYRLMMLKYGDNKPEEEFERVL